MKTPWIQLGPWPGGVDNVNSVRSLTPDKLKECVDYDIDNNGFLNVPPSLTKVTGSTAGRSLWANETGTMAFVMEGALLRRFNTDTTRTTIRSGLHTTLPMCYDEINNMYYYSNSQIIEMTDGYSVMSFQDAFTADMAIVDRQFKKVMPPGSILKFFNNRLYSVLGGRIVFSDAMHFVCYDTRFYRIDVPANITMFMPVADGIWISFGGNTYFMQGLDPDTGLTLIHKADYGAIGQAVRVPKGFLSAAMSSDMDIMWESSRGKCVGTTGGNLINLSIGKYELPDNSNNAVSYLRIKNNGIAHFISVLTN